MREREIPVVYDEVEVTDIAAMHIPVGGACVYGGQVYVRVRWIGHHSIINEDKLHDKILFCNDKAQMCTLGFNTKVSPKRISWHLQPE